MSRTDSPTAVVTGGSKGIGADIAERLLDKSYRVVNLSHIPSTWKHDRLETIEVDLSDLKTTREIATAIAATPTGQRDLRELFILPAPYLLLPISDNLRSRRRVER